MQKLKIKKVKQKINSKKNRANLIRFFFLNIFRNKFVIIFWMLSFTIVFILNIIFAKNDLSKIIEKSLLIFILPSVFNIFLITFSSIILFSNFKQNNIDIELFTKRNKKIRILFYKQSVLVIISLLSVVQIFLLKIIWLFNGVDLFTTLKIFLIESSSYILFSFFFILILTFLLNLFNNVSINNVISCFFAFLVFFCSFLLPIFIVKNSAYSNRNNIYKVLKLSNDNKDFVQLSYRDKLFEKYKEQNNLFNKMPLYISNPFFGRALNNWIDYDKNNYFKAYSNESYLSIINFNLKKERIFSSLGYDINNVSVLNPKAKSVFEYSNKTDLFQDILEEIYEIPNLKNKVEELNKKKKTNSVVNDDFLNSLNEINGNDSIMSKIWIWGESSELFEKTILPNIKIKDLISRLLGLYKKDSLLFQTFYYYDQLDKRYGLNDASNQSLYYFLRKNTNESFANFVNLLFNTSQDGNEIVRWNILPLPYKIKNRIFSDSKMKKAHTILDLLKTDSTGNLAEIDKKYIKKRWFNISYNNDVIQSIEFYYRDANVYKKSAIPKTEWSNIFGEPAKNVYDKNWFNSYLDNVKIYQIKSGVSNYKDLSDGEKPLLKKLSFLLKNDKLNSTGSGLIMPLYLHNNSKSYNSLLQKINIYKENNDHLDYLYILFFILMGTILQAFSIYKCKNYDLKYL